MPALINLHAHPDESVRKRAYETEMEAWESVQEPLAACMNGIKGWVNTLNDHRGRKDALHQPIEQARIDRETLDAMLEAMKDSFPTFRRYFKAKAARFDQAALPWWNVFAPIGKLDKEYSFDEAADFIMENFGKFSPELRDFAKTAFENNWIDAEQRAGKRGGAFCMGVPGVKESRIMCNFDGSLDQVMTIAHELGHGYHNFNMDQADKTPLQRQTPMTMAETASIMCETIVFNAVMETITDPEEELALLETALIGDSQVIVDIYSRLLFEKEVFDNYFVEDGLQNNEFNQNAFAKDFVTGNLLFGGVNGFNIFSALWLMTGPMGITAPARTNNGILDKGACARIYCPP